MKLRTIKILALSYCLCSSALLPGQDAIHINRDESVRFLEKIEIKAPKVQFKELLGVSFVFRF